MGKEVVGIIGGMGPAATADFYQCIVEATDAQRDQDHLPVLIDARPDIPDRTAFLLGRGPDPTPTLQAMATGLVRSGATLLVMACNSASPFQAAVAAAVAAPVVDWVAEAIDGMLEAAPHLTSVGLLATTGTIRSQMYQRQLNGLDRVAIVPSEAAQQEIMRAIYTIKAGDATGPFPAIDAVVAEFHDAGAEAVLIACTELSLNHRLRPATWTLPAYDAAVLVARRIVQRAGGRLRPASTTLTEGARQ